LLSLLLAAASRTAHAGEVPQRIGLDVGISDWEAVGAIEPFAPSLASDEFGRFDREGWSVGVRYLFGVARTRSGSLFLGPALTFFRHANTVGIRIEDELLTVEGDLRLRGLLLGGEAEWRFRPRGVWMPFAVAGLEYQQADTAIQVGGITTEDYDNARGFGYALGLGTDVRLTRKPGPLSMRATARVRWLDFGSVSWAVPGSPDLSGPSYEILLGFGWEKGTGTF
jgi:hypothetical protein